MPCRTFPFKSSGERSLVFSGRMAPEKPRRCECCAASLIRPAAARPLRAQTSGKIGRKCAQSLVMSRNALASIAISQSLENFRFFGGAYGVPGAELEQRIERLLRVIDLEEKRNTAAQIFREECANCWRSVARLSTIRGCCFLTSRLRGSTRFIGSKSGICFTI